MRSLLQLVRMGLLETKTNSAQLGHQAGAWAEQLSLLPPSPRIPPSPIPSQPQCCSYVESSPYVVTQKFIFF